jgi:drug/metabolite transporter (DMT)-like permease
MDPRTKTKGNLLLLLTALIWGSAFVAQSSAADVVETFTYNMARSVLGALVLLPVIYITGRNRLIRQSALPQATSKMSADAPAGSDGSAACASQDSRSSVGKAGASLAVSGNCSFGDIMRPNRTTLIGGICCGIMLATASGFQQAGVALTTAGKAGFITALYIIMVPVVYMFLGKKVAPVIWLCVVLAITGFYLLCVNEGFSISKGDILVLICAICFTGHILIIDHFSALDTDPVKMSCIQFATAAVVSGVIMLLFEHPTWEAIWAARIPIFYAGVFSSGVAYTLQIVGQRYTDPTTATLLMSLESVFAALAGWLILHETFSLKEFIGCVLVFTAVILAQIPLPSKHR